MIGSLILTSATQLRMDFAPVGIGELGLVIWIVLTCYTLLVRKLTINRLFVWYGMFWLISIPVLIVGTCVASELGNTTTMLKFTREMVALAFVMTLCLMLTLEPITGKDTCNRTMRLIRYSGFFTLLVVSIGTISPDIAPIAWWLGDRLQGLSANPNQFALFLVPIPFFIGHSFIKMGIKFYYLIIAGVVTAVGLATKSDALILCWLVGYGFILFNYFHRSIASFIQIPVNLMIIVSISLIFLALVIAITYFEAQNIFALIYSPDTEQHIQAFNRFNLWINGLKAGLDSPVFGLGPGNHSGFDNPHQNSEAHNSIIDWFTISGLIGVTAFLTLFLAQFRLAMRSSLWLAGALVAILAFSSFHYLFRHPLFWFYLILVGQLSIAGRPFTRSIRKPAGFDPAIKI